MTKLSGNLSKITDLTQAEIQAMYGLMDQFYDNMTETNFISDLTEKDSAILLRHEDGTIVGFSTQKLLEIPVAERIVHGVFSGDTIIHKDYWGNMELFWVFSKHFLTLAEQYPEFYWFLISKGYKTYKMLPLFFNEYYPNYKTKTPERIKHIMDAYGYYCYPDEYNPIDGVIHYRSTKDWLKEGIADITPQKLKDPDIAFFIKQNPQYHLGNDIVCLASLKQENIKKKAWKLLTGKN